MRKIKLNPLQQFVAALLLFGMLGAAVMYYIIDSVISGEMYVTRTAQRRIYS